MFDKYDIVVFTLEYLSILSFYNNLMMKMEFDFQFSKDLITSNNIRMWI